MSVTMGIQLVSSIVGRIDECLCEVEHAFPGMCAPNHPRIVNFQDFASGEGFTFTFVGDGQDVRASITNSPCVGLDFNVSDIRSLASCPFFSKC